MTLTELSYYLRRAIPVFIIFILFSLIIFFSFKLLFLYKETNKKPTIFINPIFNKINRPILKEATKSAGFNFTLDTVEGVPVTATETAKVYFLPKQTAKFGYREKVYLMAKHFGFDSERDKYELINNEALFKDEDKELKINITNFNFSFKKNLKIIDKEKLTRSNLFVPFKKQIENQAIDFLTKINRYPEELAKGVSRVIYLKYDQEIDSFINVEDKKEANLAEVDFFRLPIDDIDFVSPKFFNSQNYLIFLFTENNGYELIKGQIAFFEKSEEQYGIYPVKTGEEVWSELINGKAEVVSARIGIKDIVIKSMKLYYLDPEVYQPYLQPVYVFYDDKDFVAYVPAVKNQFLLEE